MEEPSVVPDALGPLGRSAGSVDVELDVLGTLVVLADELERMILETANQSEGNCRAAAKADPDVRSVARVPTSSKEIARPPSDPWWLRVSTLKLSREPIVRKWRSIAVALSSACQV